MKADSFDVSLSNVKWNAISGNKLSIIFFFLSVFSGLAAAILGNTLGWISLLLLPSLLISIVIFLEPDFGIAAFAVVVYSQLKRAIAIYHPGFPALLSPAYLLLASLIFLIIWRALVYGDKATGWKRAGMILLLVAFWLFSAATADDPAHGMIKFQKYTENALFAFVVIFFIQKPKSLHRIIWAFLLAELFLASLTVLQNLTHTYGNAYWGFAQWEYSSTNGTTNYRAAGMYGNANAYAQSLIVFIPLALDRFWHEKKILPRLIATLALAFCTLAVFFTYSRNGFVTLIFTIGLLIAIRRPNITPVILTGALMLLLLQFLPSTYTSRISTLFQFTSSEPTSRVTDSSFRGRLSENIAAWRMFKDHPLVGVGLDNFEINYQDYSRKIGLDPRRTPRAPASFYLELLSEQGIIGTLLFTFFIIMVFKSLLNARQSFTLQNMDSEAHLAAAFFAGLAGYMFFYISKSGSYSNAFWILIGIALSFEQVAKNSRRSKAKR